MKKNQKKTTARLKAEVIHAKENAAAEKRGYDGPTLPFGPNTLIGYQHLSPHERRSADVRMVSGELDFDGDKEESTADRKRWAHEKAKAQARIDADTEATALLSATRQELRSETRGAPPS
jgi:hypothetical protein